MERCLMVICCRSLKEIFCLHVQNSRRIINIFVSKKNLINSMSLYVITNISSNQHHNTTENAKQHSFRPTSRCVMLAQPRPFTQCDRHRRLKHFCQRYLSFVPGLFFFNIIFLLDQGLHRTKGPAIHEE